jgi:hypothetical protein
VVVSQTGSWAARKQDNPAPARRKSSAAWSGSGYRQKQMVKPKRSAEQQVADEADRGALNPVASRKTISDGQAEPEFQENHKRLKADRIRREKAAKK